MDVADRGDHGDEARGGGGARHDADDHGECRACGTREPPRARSRVWWIPLGMFWAVLLGFGACFAILLPLNLLLVPAWLAVGSSVGPLARKLTEPRCPSCGAPATSRVRTRAALPEVARRPARPADERAMEGALV